MADSFGASYRKDTKDVNAGIANDATRGFESSLNVRGTQIVYSDPSFTSARDTLVSGLLRIGGDQLSKSADREKKTNFANRMAEATQLELQEGADTLSENEKAEGMLTAIFGRTNTEDSFRAKVIETSITKKLSSIELLMDDHVKTVSSKDFAKVGNTKLTELLKLYEKTPSLKNKIITEWTNGWASLQKQHTKPRLKFERDRAAQAYEDNIHTKASAIRGTTNSIAKKKHIAAFRKSIKNTGNMYKDEISDRLMSAIQSGLDVNDRSLYDLLSTDVLIDQEDKRDLPQMIQKFEVAHESKYPAAVEQFSRVLSTANTQQDLEPALALIEQLAAKWPTQDRTAVLTTQLLKREQEIILAEQELQRDIKLYGSNDWQKGALNKQREQEVYTRTTDNILKNKLLDDPSLDLFERQNITPEQIKQLKFDRPELVLSTWLTRAVENDADLQANQSELVSIVRSASFTEADNERMESLIKNLSVYKKARNEQFMATFVDDKEAAFGSAVMYMHAGGWPAENIVQKLRELESLPEPDMKDDYHQGALAGAISSAHEKYVDSKGNANYWTLGLTNKNPDNDYKLKQTMQEEAENLYKIFKGDSRLVSQVLYDKVAKTSLMIGNNFYPGLGTVQKDTDFSIPDYIKGLNASENFRQGPLRAARFPPFTNIVDDGNINWSKDMFSGELRVSWGDGTSYRSVGVPLPRNTKMMVDYKTIESKRISPLQLEKKRIQELERPALRP